MSSAGMSGMSDMGQTRPQDERADAYAPGTPPSGAAPGTPSERQVREGVEGVEVVEVVTMESAGKLSGAPSVFDTSPEVSGGGFRWWYVPVIALPAGVIGAAGVIWYIRRQRERRARAALAAATLARQRRDLLALARSSEMARRATKTWRRSVNAARQAAEQAGEQAGELREHPDKVLSILGAAALAERAGETWGGARDQLESLRKQIPWSQRRAMRKQVEHARRTAGKRLERAQRRGARTITGGKVVLRAGKVTTTSGRAAMPIVVAVRTTGERTGKMVRQTRRSVNSAWKQTRAFTFGALLSAMTTYILGWRRALTQRQPGQAREAAGSR